MSDDKPININGSNITGGNVNIGGSQTVSGDVSVTLQGVTNTISNLNAAEDQKAALQALFTQLESALKTYAASHPAEVTQIAKRAKDAVEEAASTTPDKESLAAKTTLLKSAANNIREVMPAVFGIAVTIVGSLLRLGS
jgi:hypothetical protein